MKEIERGISSKKGLILEFNLRDYLTSLIYLEKSERIVTMEISDTTNESTLQIIFSLVKLLYSDCFHFLWLCVVLRCAVGLLDLLPIQPF